MTGVDLLRLNPTPQALAEAVATDFVSTVSALAAAKSEGEYVEVGIAGGFVATTVIPAIARAAGDTDWSHLRIWWIDERFVADGHSDRNDAEAMRNGLDALSGATTMPMPVDTGQGVEAARESFAQLWSKEMHGDRFDIVLAGMGPDGHIASLFPGHPWANTGAESSDIISVEDSPKPPPQRLSVSMPVLLRARNFWLCAAGAAKASVLEQVFSGADPANLPLAALVSDAHPWDDIRRKDNDVRFYVDTAAAGGLVV